MAIDPDVVVELTLIRARLDALEARPIGSMHPSKYVLHYPNGEVVTFEPVVP